MSLLPCSSRGLRVPGVAALGRIIGLLALAALLQACSAVKLAYNNAQDVTYWWLDGYVDFTEVQTLRLRDDLARLQAWHRQAELPRYAELLDRAAQMAGGDLTPEQVCGMFAEAQARVQPLADQAEPGVVALAMSLKPEQIDHIQAKYDKTNADYRRDWVRPPLQDQRDKRYKQVLERSEMVYGRLDDTQRELIRQQVAQSSFDGPTSYAERVRRQQDLLQTLRRIQAEKPAPAEVRQWMRTHLERSLRSPDPAYRAYQQTLTQENCRSFARVHNTTTPPQREAAAQRLRDYARLLRELSAQK